MGWEDKGYPGKGLGMHEIKQGVGMHEMGIDGVGMHGAGMDG